MENDMKNQLVEKARYEMSLDLTVPLNTINDSTTLALKDKYLYDLIGDWLSERNDHNKNELLKEIVNYTDEILRVKRL